MEMPHPQLPRSKPLYEQVVELLEKRILDGEYPVGGKLPTESELAAEYMVSRTVIREAIKALRTKGLVDTHAGKGTFVVSASLQGVDTSFAAATRSSPDRGWGHLIEIREMLEPEIAALAANRADEALLAKMQQAIDLMDQALAKDPEDLREFLEADFCFHMCLAEATGNPLVLMIISPVVRLMRDLQRYQLARLEDRGRRSQQNHKRIMSAVLNHDAELARQFMLQHIRQVREDVEAPLKIRH